MQPGPDTCTAAPPIQIQIQIPTQTQFKPSTVQQHLADSVPLCCNVLHSQRKACPSAATSCMRQLCWQCKEIVWSRGTVAYPCVKNSEPVPASKLKSWIRNWACWLFWQQGERGSRQHEAGVGHEEEAGPHGVLAKVPDVCKGRLRAGEGQEDAGEGAPARVSERLEIDVACMIRNLPQRHVQQCHTQQGHC